MIAADVVVHNSPDRTDALALICTGIVIAAIMAGLVWLSNRANDFWADREERATRAAEHVATKTRTFTEIWAGTREGAARAQASIDAGECQVTIAALHRKPKNETRLADFKRSTRRSA